MALYTEKAREELLELVGKLTCKPKIKITTEATDNKPRDFTILCGYSYDNLCKIDQSYFCPDKTWRFGGRGIGLVQNGTGYQKTVDFSPQAKQFCEELAEWYKKNVSCPSKQINIDYHMYQHGVDKDKIFDISVETF